VALVNRRASLPLCLALLSPGARPQPVNAAEREPQQAVHQIKAAYLFKFLGFVEWPASAFADPAAPIRIGVMAADGLAAELERAVAGRQVQGRPVATQRLPPTELPRGLHLLYTGRGAQARLPTLLPQSRGQALLTVSESDGSPVPGSAITFVVDDDRLRFDVAPAVAEQHHVRISARLLAVARRVLEAPP
jgi:hypothetical protein